jgi:hypothetical protein
MGIKNSKKAFIKGNQSNPKKLSFKKKFCRIHGETNHSTSECFTVKKFEQKDGDEKNLQQDELMWKKEEIDDLKERKI